MFWLVAVTILWAFSFSLIGEYLAGAVDPYFSVLVRCVLAFLLFVPFLRVRGIARNLACKLTAIGSVQLGLMYLFYYHSFELLTVPEVLVFTILTPLYVTLLNDLLKKRFSPWYLASAALAVAGAAVIRYHSLTSDFLYGFLVVQGANFCFAAGQVAYKRLMEVENNPAPAHTVYAFFYLGALIVAAVGWCLQGQPVYPESATQWGVLLWLGLAASGGGYFLWNRGATQVNAGTLASMNNALVPAGLFVNFALWGKEADLVKLAAGAVIIVLSVWLSQRVNHQTQAVQSDD